MPPTPRKNAAPVRRFLNDAVASEDTDAVATFLDEDTVDHSNRSLTYLIDPQ